MRPDRRVRVLSPDETVGTAAVVEVATITRERRASIQRGGGERHPTSHLSSGGREIGTRRVRVISPTQGQPLIARFSVRKSSSTRSSGRHFGSQQSETEITSMPPPPSAPPSPPQSPPAAARPHPSSLVVVVLGVLDEVADFVGRREPPLVRVVGLTADVDDAVSCGPKTPLLVLQGHLSDQCRVGRDHLDVDLSGAGSEAQTPTPT